MIHLPHSLSAWGTPEFREILTLEIEKLDAGLLPLQQGLATSSYVAEGKFSVMVIGVTDDPGFIRVKLGIFYAGIIGGCSCADDPTPVNEQNEYCEVLLAISKQTAETGVLLIGELQ